MQWCLAESRRQKYRKAAAESTCIGICQDKRGTRSLLRFRCSDKKLEVTDGIMALTREVGTTQFSGAAFSSRLREKQSSNSSSSGGGSGNASSGGSGDVSGEGGGGGERTREQRTAACGSQH